MAKEVRQTDAFFRDLLQSLKLYRVWGFLAVNDLRVRYARSRLGFAWIIVSFAVWAGGVGLVYAQLFDLTATQFVPFLTIGFALWGFISASIVESGSAFLVATGYVKQFSLPKQIYVWRIILSQAISLALTLLICGAVVIWFRPTAVRELPLALPGLVLLLLAGSLHAFLFAYLTPYVRDLPHAASSALNVIFFLTPIIFPPELLQKRGLSILSSVNPFHFLIESVRAPLLTGRFPDSEAYIGALVYLCLLGFVTMLLCRRLDRLVVYAL